MSETSEATIAKMRKQQEVLERQINWLEQVRTALLDVAKGSKGYLEALPLQYRPDEKWFAPLNEAIRFADPID